MPTPDRSNNNELKPEVAKAIRRVDLQREAVLDSTIDFTAKPAPDWLEPAAINSIFLTGATGFLGVHLLHELLQQTQAEVYCLVRCVDREDGFRRLYHKLAANLLWDESFHSRIIPVAGDLAQPYLGLSPQEFYQLAEQIDAIYHNGAVVKFLQPYSTLKPANVEGTQEIIRLAAQAKLKPIHYVSTVFVFGLAERAAGQVIYEDAALGDGNDLLLGYFQSKWVAEHLLMLARERGLPVFIYRPGILIGDSQTGVWDNQDDFLCRAIKGCIQLGLWPELDAELSLAPVDYVSKALVHLAQQSHRGKDLSLCYHLVNPHSVHLDALCEWMQSFGYPIRRAPLKEWQAKLAAQATRPQDNALAVLTPLLVKRRSSSGQRTFTEIYDQGKAPQFDCQNTLRALDGSSIVCPAIGREHFRRYFFYFTERGFLAAPPMRDA